MPCTGPIKRRDPIRRFKRLGFKGPFSGGRHQFMVRGNVTVWICNPYKGKIGNELFLRILRQAGIKQDEWESLG